MKPPLSPAFARMKRENEAASASAASPIVSRIRAVLLPQQVAVIDDPAQFKSVKVPRRGGKTVTAAAYLIDFCERNPGARCVFGSMTLKSAKRLIWSGKDGLKRWNTKYSLGIDFNNAETTATFPNGSVIIVMGFETQGDIDKIRGDALDLVILDECKSFPPSIFDELVDEAITPALMDNAGTLVIMGTPGAVLRGRFYEATSTDGCTVKIDDDGVRHAIARPWSEASSPEWSTVEFDWSFHTWTIADNTAHVVRRKDGTTSTLWEEALKLKRRKRWSDDNPVWRREYLGHWVADDAVLVYRYVASKNSWKPRSIEGITNHLGLPNGHEWRYGLGADLGYDNLFAIEVFAWCDDLLTIAELELCGVNVASLGPIGDGLSCYFQVYEYGEAGLTNRGVAAAVFRAREVIGTDFDFMVADRGNLGKAQLASLEEEYGLVFEPAEKHEKNAHVEVWNSDLVEGRCFIRAESRLAAEMEVLPWKLPRGVFDLKREGAPLIKKYEDDNFAKDHCDAGLYCVTRAQHRFARLRERPPKPGTPEHLVRMLAEEKRRAFNPPQPVIDGGWRGRKFDLN